MRRQICRTRPHNIRRRFRGWSQGEWRALAKLEGDVRDWRLVFVIPSLTLIVRGPCPGTGTRLRLRAGKTQTALGRTGAAFSGRGDEVELGRIGAVWRSTTVCAFVAKDAGSVAGVFG